MVRQAIISKHIVLTSSTHSHFPCYGIILIEDELIYDVVIIESNIPSSIVMEKYRDWNPEDFSDLYISPGIIDINARVEWETYTEFTQAAISGGVTVILAESGYYNDTIASGEMYSDIGKVATIEISTLDSIPLLVREGYLAVKGYLFPPHSTIQCIPANLGPVLKEIENTCLTFIVDPNLPDPRMLHAVSPFRLCPLRDRLKSDHSSQPYSGGFPDLIDNDEDDDFYDDEQEEQTISAKRLQSRKSIAVGVKKIISPGIDGIVDPHVPIRGQGRNTAEMILDYSQVEDIDPAFVESVNKNLRKQKTNTMNDDLNKRIKRSQMTIRNLSLAEIETYKSAGVTEYNTPKTPTPGQMNPESPLPSPGAPKSTTPSAVDASKGSVLQRRKFVSSLSLVVKSTPPPKENVYNIHMANYSHTWENSGILKVLAALPKSNCRVHITSISSASSFNKIRHAKEIYPKLTCEIPASHLIFSNKSIPENDTRFKNSPPIRNQGNTNLIWDLLKLKGIDAITSNHVSINSLYKLTKNNFQRAANGMPTIGFTLQAVWTTLNGPISTHSQLEHYIVRMAKWMSLHPAEILSISSTRGSISKGKFADLIIWNPFEKYLIENEYSPFPEMSPFLGMQMYGRIHRVYLRGGLAYNQGKFKARGRFLLRLNH